MVRASLFLMVGMLVACRGERHERRLSPGVPVHGTIAPSRSQEWQIEAKAGELVQATLTIEGVEGGLRIEQGDRIIARSAQRNIAIRPASAIVARGPLRLVLEASPGPSGAAAGRFVVELTPPRAATDRDRRLVAAEASEADAVDLLGAYQVGETRKAMERYVEVAAVYRDLGEEVARADVLLSIVYCQMQLGQRPDALAAAEAALTAWQAIGDRRGEMMAHEWLARAALDAGDVARANAAYDRAIAIGRQLPAPSPELARALSNRSTAQITAEAWDDAIASLTESLAINRSLGQRAAEAFDHHNLASAYAYLRDPDRALEHQEQAVAIIRELGDRPLVAMMVGELANIRQFAGDAERARPDAIESLKLRRELGDPLSIGNGLQLLGAVDRRRGDPGAALASHREALALFRGAGAVGESRVALAQVGMDQRALGDRAAAAITLREAITLADAAGAKDEAARDRVELAHALRGSANDEALARVEEALALYEEIRATLADADSRRSYFTGVRAAYELEIELLLDRDRCAEAFTAAERARARGLLEGLRGATVAPEIAADEVQGWLSADTALVEISLGARRSVAWIVTHEGTRCVELGPGGPLEALARGAIEPTRARRVTIDGETAAQQTARVQAADRAQRVVLRELSLRLFRPLAPALKARRIVLVLDGALHFVPFAAVPDPAGDEPLVEAHEIVVLPSAAVLRELRARHSSPRHASRVAVLADPVFSADDPRLPRPAATAVTTRGGPPELDLVRLRASRDEAQGVAARFPGAFVALDGDASRATLARAEVRTADIVHIATHGIVDTRYPERSGLMLSRYGADGVAHEGFLGLEELGHLGLGARLVVLSACDTAMGKIVVGEGARALSHALLAAGVPQVVASLWSVHDDATRQLMEHFYAALAGAPSHAAALQAAQRAMRRDPRYRAPYYWAGFVAYGDWR